MGLVSFGTLVLLICWYSALTSSRSTVIIDADVGTDFDDIVAIGYAISRSDIFDIKLLLMASFNTTGRAQLMAKFLHYVNRTDIDIGIGIHTPNYRNLYNGVGAQMYWADDYYLYDYPGNIYDDGLLRAKQILQTGTFDNPIYVIAIGPYTNLAQILTDDANLKQNMRLITMGGAIYKGYGTNYTESEYNIFENGTASQIVWNNTDQIPFTYNICAAPLDTTYYFQLYGLNYKKLLDSNELLPKIILENYNVWYDNGGNVVGEYRKFNPLNATSCLYDVQAVFMAAMLSEHSLLYGQQIECNDSFIPFMRMQSFKIIVQIIDDKFYTVIDTNINSSIQMVDIAMSWNEGNYNGTYKLGESIVNSLIAQSTADDGNKLADWIIVVLCLLIVLIILGISIIVYIYYRKRKKKNSEFNHIALTDELQNDQNDQ